MQYYIDVRYTTHAEVSHFDISETCVHLLGTDGQAAVPLTVCDLSHYSYDMMGQ